MPKFFRKIRQKLLSENRFSKYLIYAIGEIILVVIGILIALQINNWNENQKARKAEIVLIKQLTKDLQKDAENLKAAIPRLKDKSAVVKQIYLETQNRASFDGSMNYGDLTWQIFTPLFFEQRHQESVNQVSSDTLAKQILNYFDQQKIVEFQIGQSNEDIRVRLRPFLGDNGVMNTNHIMSTNSYMEIRDGKSNFIKYEDLKKIYGSKKFEFLIFELRMGYIAAIREVQLLSDENKKLIEALSSYIYQKG